MNLVCIFSSFIFKFSHTLFVAPAVITTKFSYRVLPVYKFLSSVSCQLYERFFNNSFLRTNFLPIISIWVNRYRIIENRQALIVRVLIRFYIFCDFIEKSLFCKTMLCLATSVWNSVLLVSLRFFVIWFLIQRDWHTILEYTYRGTFSISDPALVGEISLEVVCLDKIALLSFRQFLFLTVSI